MSCDNLPTTVEIEQAKKDITDFNTFMTSTSNTFIDSNGITRLTLRGSIDKFGFGEADFTFTSGGALLDRKLLVSNDPIDGFLYRYVGTGTFPITVTAGTDPTTGTDWEAFTATAAEFISKDGGGSVQDHINDYDMFKGRYIASQPTIAHFGSDDRSAMQRTLHLVGDSHTYGQGSRGDTGDFLLQNHSTRYGACTWSTMLKEALYKDWGSNPAQFVPSTGGSNAENKTTGVRGIYTKSENVALENSDFIHPNKNFYALDEHFTAKEIRMLNYNTTQGFYSRLCMFVGYEQNSDKLYRIPNSHTFTPTGMSWYDQNGRCGIFTSINCIDGVSRPRAFITSNFLVPEITDGDVFYMQCHSDFPDLVASLAVMRQCVCEDIQTIDGKYMYAFSFSDGASLDQASLEALMTDSEARFLIAPAVAPSVIVPISSPRSLVGIDLICGVGGVNTTIELAPTNGSNSYLAGDWYYSAAASSGQGFNIDLIDKSSDSNMTSLNTSFYQFLGSNPIPDKIVELYTSDNLNQVGASLYSDLAFWLYYSVKVTGNLILKPTKPKKYTQSTIGFNIGIRGVIDTDMVKICTHGFGCHSVGDWIGRTADICSHDEGVPFDHTVMMRKCEELQNQETRMMVVQAPIVNEYLRQTSIAQYKSDLTSFYNLMMNGDKKLSRFVIFTGAGQIGHDSYLGPVTTSSPITYQMYRDATKDWAIENGIAYVDASLRQKQMIDDGLAIGTDFLMKTGADYDSNHPNMYVHKLWFEAIYPIVSRIFQ